MEEECESHLLMKCPKEKLLNNKWPYINEEIALREVLSKCL